MEDNKIFTLDKITDLKYGENPHQKAALYKYQKCLEYELIGAAELTHNNILDSSVALEIASEFFDVFGVVMVKHSIPSAVALAKDLTGAWTKAFDSDPISAFGACVAFTKGIDLNLAKTLSGIQLSIILAPEFSDEAVSELKKNQTLKIIKVNTPLKNITRILNEDIKLTPFGVIIQEKDTKDFDINTFKVKTKRKPEQSEAEDMIFASKIAKHVKSNAAVVAKDLRTLGICAGETNRISAIESALNKVCDSTKDAVIATDGAISTKDTVLLAVQNRVKGIIQPFGSYNDNEIIETANKYELSMISTGIRHFKH